MRAYFTPQAEIDLEEISDYIALHKRCAPGHRTRSVHLNYSEME
jgi:hypothetical protein